MSHAIIHTIPTSQTDELLRANGYDLLDEYVTIIEEGGFDLSVPIIELATGTGRTAAILARRGFDVITGDITLEKRAEALARITPAFFDKVSMSALNMERLPFRDNSIKSVISLNTVHELDRPVQCLQELIRIHDPEGILIVGDFNETGFAVMEEAHRKVFGRNHARGRLPIEDVAEGLSRSYRSVITIETPLNISFRCTAKPRT